MKPKHDESYKELPLHTLLDLPLEEMTDEELSAFVEVVRTARNSAQVRKSNMRGTRKTAPRLPTKPGRRIDISDLLE
jgi:hypothetical protein